MPIYNFYRPFEVDLGLYIQRFTVAYSVQEQEDNIDYLYGPTSERLIELGLQ